MHFTINNQIYQLKFFLYILSHIFMFCHFLLSRELSPFYCDTHSCSSIHCGSVSEQDADDVRLVGAGSQVEGGLSTHCGEVGVSVVLDQVDHNVHVTHEGGNVEGGQARL